jgi:hypothetical protein
MKTNSTAMNAQRKNKNLLIIYRGIIEIMKKT